MLEAITPQGLAPSASPYSPAVRVDNLLFCSGATPFDADGNLAGPDFAAQVHQTLQNLELVCQAAGTSLKNAVKVGVYLSTLDNFAILNEIYPQYVGTPFPARTTIPAALRGFDIEIDAVVAIPS